jgi:hypothetical protein
VPLNSRCWGLGPAPARRLAALAHRGSLGRLLHLSEVVLGRGRERRVPIRDKSSAADAKT